MADDKVQPKVEPKKINPTVEVKRDATTRKPLVERVRREPVKKT